MTIGNTGNTPSTGPLKPAVSVSASAKLKATVSVEAGVKPQPADKPPAAPGDVSTARPGWPAVGMTQPKDDDWPSYATLFGKAPYVKDPNTSKVKDIVKAAVEADPKLGESPVGAALKADKLDAEAIKALQKHLKAAGYDLGPAGADGKLGPKTYAALVAFIDNDGKAQAKPGKPNLVDGKHGMGVDIPEAKKKPYLVDGKHGMGVEIPKKPLTVDGHGTGVEIPEPAKKHAMGVDIQPADDDKKKKKA